MAESHAQLMQIRNYVPGCVEAIDSCPLMVINDESSVPGARGSKPCRKLGTNPAAESGVESVHLMLGALSFENNGPVGRSPDVLHTAHDLHTSFLELSQAGI